MWDWQDCQCLCFNKSLKDTELLMEKYPFVYGAFGIHPDDADKMTQETLDEIKALSASERQWLSERLGLIITGTRKKQSMSFRKKCFVHRWRLQENKNAVYDAQGR